MDAKTCLKKLEYVGVLAFATVDAQGNPQVRNISAVHYEPDALYFFTARGKDFCRELLEDGRVQILGYTRYKEMIRLSAQAKPVSQEEQQKWIDTIFREQPYPGNLCHWKWQGERKGIPDYRFVHRMRHLRFGLPAEVCYNGRCRNTVSHQSGTLSALWKLF